MNEIAVLGAGAFGTALAVALAREGAPVALWARSNDQRDSLRAARMNAGYLPGIDFPEQLRIADSFSTGAETVLIAVPAQSLDRFLAEAGTELDGRDIVLCCKGVDRQSGRRPSEIASQACPNSRIAVLTGPSFADEIGRGLPTALTLATGVGGEDLQERLSTQALRIYLSHDVTGAELGGALKNVVALAAGITVGAELGESARAALVTRGYAEMLRFAVAQGAEAATLQGLSGLGDLVLTCTSKRSRNFSAGIALGSGQALPGSTTIEGLATAEAVQKIAKNAGIETPITTVVAGVVRGRLSVEDAIRALMARPLKKE